MQFIGIAIELLAYCSFLGLAHWRRPVIWVTAVASTAFALAVTLIQSPNAIIVTGTLSAGLLYATMSWALWRHRPRAPQLIGVMSAMDGLLATLLLSKALMGLLFISFVPFTTNAINVALYIGAFTIMASNGLGFLLLVKSDDDQRLHHALGELTDADNQQRQFIAMLSHEVRSPMAVIDASTQLLSLHLQNAPEHKPVLERIERGLKRLKYFFDNCLTQNRIESFNYALKASPVDMVRLVALECEGCQPLANHHRVVFDTTFAAQQVQGDEMLLRIMVMNLLNNAIRFSPEGSTITVRIGEPEGTGMAFRLEVADQGPGIPADEIDAIFNKYTRGRTAEGLPGAGLGLTIVQRIANLHSGAVLVRNLPTGGACFVVELAA
jgi:signal transduction histidine kinase